MFRFSKPQLLKTAHALALAAVVAVGFSGSLNAAQQGAGTLLSREQLLQAALAGDPSARVALRALFGDAGGDSNVIASMAAGLIGSLVGDPVAITDAAILISDVASEALASQPIVRLMVDSGFTLPPGVKGWDLGAPDSPTYVGFSKLTQNDKQIVSGSSGGIQRPGGDGLLSDGLINVSRIILDVGLTDGSYRLILLTDDQGNQVFVNPLGKAVTVNGIRTAMPTGTPESWIQTGQLVGTAASSVLSGGAYGTGTGGATVIPVQVVDGRLIIEFEAAANSDILLTGFILEPVEGPSVLSTPEKVFTTDNEILTAEAVIADAIGLTVEAIASAAGDEGVREDILKLDKPEAEVPDAVSPS